MRKLDDLILTEFNEDGTLQFYDNFLSSFPFSNYAPTLYDFVDFITKERKAFRKERYPGVAERGYDEAFF